MDIILTYIKKLIPKALFKKLQPGYHYVLNFLAALFYGFPSNKLVVVGITGTTGKTTVTYLTAQMLRAAGVTVGYTSTALLSDGKRDWLNDKKMTMLGRFFTQKMLAQMVQNGCTVAIVETTSEGIVQFRHRFINYDVVLFTGLYPEHIESHGSFENYKQAKLQLFKHLGRCRPKKLPITNYQLPMSPHSAIQNSISKTIIANGDDEHAADFLAPWAEEKVVFAMGSDQRPTTNDPVKDVKLASLATSHGAGTQQGSGDQNYQLPITNYQLLPYSYTGTTAEGVQMTFDGAAVQLQLLGDFTATNAAAAAAVGRVLELDNAAIVQGLHSVANIPGRLERIDAGQPFTVIVDYAFEPVAVTKLYETIAVLEPQKVIHVLGSTGGGRDVARRAQLGQIAGAKADVVIVTNEDPYDDDPQEIINAVAQGAVDAGKVEGTDLFRILDRRDAIEKAVSLASPGDVVLITGKGSEQAIVVEDNKKIPWDDRKVVREVLEKRG